MLRTSVEHVKGLRHPRGLKRVVMRDPWRAAQGAFAAVGAIWTLIELSSFFFDWIETNKIGIAIVAGIGAFLIWLLWLVPPESVVVDVLGGRITIKFGDFFKTDAVRILGVNDCFDTTNDGVVSATSIHGQLIVNELSSDTARFRRDVDKSLRGAPFEELRHRATGHSKRHNIGQTALLEARGFTYVLVAIGETDLSDNKVSTSVEQYVAAVSSSLRRARSVANGRAVVLPLIGAGLSGVAMSPQQLLTLLFSLVLEADRRQRIAGEVMIVLRDDMRERVDLAAIVKTLP